MMLEKEREIEKDWIRVPHWSHWLRFFSIIASAGLAVGGVFLIAYFWRVLELGSSSKEQTYSIGRLVILPWFVVEYVLVALPFVCFVAWWKKGFGKLKGCGDDGLVFGLVVGLVVGLVFGLVVGLVFGLVVGLITEFEKD